MERRARNSASNGFSGQVSVSRRNTLEEVADRLVHERGSGPGHLVHERGSGPGQLRRLSGASQRSPGHRQSGSRTTAAAVSSMAMGSLAGPTSSSSATPPVTASSGSSDYATRIPTGEARTERAAPEARFAPSSSTTSEQTRRRLREGGAALLSSGRGRSWMNSYMQGGSSPSSANPSVLRRGAVGSRSDDVSSDRVDSPPPGDNASWSAGIADRPTFEQEDHVLQGEEHQSEWRDTFRDADEDDLDEERRQRNRELELHARVRGLQRQLEGLQMATAHLQAVVTQTSDHSEIEAVGHDNRRARSPPVATAVAERGRAGERDRATQEVHPHVTCDGCGRGPPVFGQVMKCSDCADFDFCEACYQDRDQLGHPRDHRFLPRTPSSSDQLAMMPLAGGRGPMAGILLRLLEAEMLYEALRQSADPQEEEEETQEEKELRSAEVLSTLERVRWSPPSECKEEDGRPSHSCEECCLCLEEYTRGEEVLKLHCRHLFHEGCLGPWLTKSLTCPMCKAEVNPASVD